VKKSIEVLHRPSHGLLDGSSDERPIEETRKTRSRLICDDEPVYAAIARRFKVAFMANIGQPSLPAYVRDGCVLFERFQFHIQGALAIEQLDHDCCSITGVAPPCRSGIFDTNEIGPILRPVPHVRDIGKRLGDGDIKGVRHLDAQHENLVLFRTRHIPGAELAIIPEAGHLSNMEQPEVFNAHVRRFCLSQNIE
jgi:hypothetical protein